jgi:hypothetical protein
LRPATSRLSIDAFAATSLADYLRDVDADANDFLGRELHDQPKVEREKPMSLT